MMFIDNIENTACPFGGSESGMTVFLHAHKKTFQKVRTFGRLEKMLTLKNLPIIWDSGCLQFAAPHPLSEPLWRDHLPCFWYG